jgi:hypothetical protein
LRGEKPVLAKAGNEKYFGFKGRLLITRDGAVKGFEMTAANIDERDVLPELTEGLTGDVIADKGLIRPALTEGLRNQGLQLHTPLRSNMTDDRPAGFVSKCMFESNPSAPRIYGISKQKSCENFWLQFNLLAQI